MKWTEFDPVTGRIYQTVDGVQVVKPAITSTRDILDEVLGNGATACIDPVNRSLIARPACSIALAAAGLVVTLTNVNLGTVIQIGGDVIDSLSQDSADGVIQVTFSDAGTYTLSAEQFPELPFSASVTVS